MFYQRFSPSPALARDVECIWFMRRPAMADGGVERILPDGCMELIFNLGAPFRVVEDDGRRSAQPCALLVGQLSRRLLLEPTGASEILAVRFTPAGAAAFFPFALNAIVDGHAAVDVLGVAARELEARLREAPTTAARLRMLEAALHRWRRRDVPARVAVAVERLRTCAGQVRVATVAQELDVTPRQLERDFARWVGLAPKPFARLMRFQRMFRALDAGDARWAEVAAECGYSDQAHLANEFRELSGLAPTEYFRQATAMGKAFTA